MEIKSSSSVQIEPRDKMRKKKSREGIELKKHTERKKKGENYKIEKMNNGYLHLSLPIYQIIC